MSPEIPKSKLSTIRSLYGLTQITFSVSSFFAMVTFVICRIRKDPQFPPSLGALMVGSITFVAVLILSANDRMKHRNVAGCVRPFLLPQRDMNAARFCREFPDHHPEIITEIRAAVARFYGVPPEKLHPLHRLSDYEFRLIEPSFHIIIVSEVLERFGLAKSTYKFSANTCSTFSDFVEEVATIIESA